MSVRTRRVSGELQKALGAVLGREHGDVTDGLMTVTDVEASPDLRNAKVFVSILGGHVAPEKVIRVLNDRAPEIRHAISSLVYLRTIPALMFVMDATGEQAERINKLINEWHTEQEGRDQEPKA